MLNGDYFTMKGLVVSLNQGLCMVFFVCLNLNSFEQLH